MVSGRFCVVGGQEFFRANPRKLLLERGRPRPHERGERKEPEYAFNAKDAKSLRTLDSLLGFGPEEYWD